jgi:hypothetical protein
MVMYHYGHLLYMNAQNRQAGHMDMLLLSSYHIISSFATTIAGGYALCLSYDEIQ